MFDKFFKIIKIAEELNQIDQSLPKIHVADAIDLSSVKTFVYDSAQGSAERLETTPCGLAIIDLAVDAADTFYEEATIKKLKTYKDKKNKVHHRYVLARVSVGIAEQNRIYWGRDIRKKLSGLLDVVFEDGMIYKSKYWSQKWKTIMFDYIDDVINAGFDGICFDNLETYKNLSTPTNKDISPLLLMKTLLKHLISYAKRKKPGFIIILHDAPELYPDHAFMADVDGVMKANLYYRDFMKRDRASYLNELASLKAVKKQGKSVFVIEHVNSNISSLNAKANMKMRGFAGCVNYSDLTVSKPLPI